MDCTIANISFISFQSKVELRRDQISTRYFTGCSIIDFLSSSQYLTRGYHFLLHEFTSVHDNFQLCASTVIIILSGHHGVAFCHQICIWPKMKFSSKTLLCTKIQGLLLTMVLATRPSTLKTAQIFGWNILSAKQTPIIVIKWGKRRIQKKMVEFIVKQPIEESDAQK